MSCNYRFDRDVTRKEFMEILKTRGVYENINENTKPSQFCITDGEDYMWCYPDIRNGIEYVTYFCRYGSNYPAEEFLYAVANECGVHLYSEHEDEY